MMEANSLANQPFQDGFVVSESGISNPWNSAFFDLVRFE
jgi:hypothetical protein